MDDDFIERYAAKCAARHVIIGDTSRTACARPAERHPPDNPGFVPEIDFSVRGLRATQAIGSVCSRKLIARRGRRVTLLRITTGAQNTRRCGRSPQVRVHI